MMATAVVIIGDLSNDDHSPRSRRHPCTNARDEQLRNPAPYSSCEHWVCKVTATMMISTKPRPAGPVFSGTVQQLARELRMPASEITEAINDLIRTGHLRKVSGSTTYRL
jgi:hypothetical protein